VNQREYLSFHFCF